jgi:hypothetical protein
MHNNLNNSDYIKILEYYKIPIPKSNRLLKIQAENILAKKLCRCIKKVNTNNDEPRAIGICSKTIINRKGLTSGTFKCKGKESIILKKRSNFSLNNKNKSNSKTRKYRN